VESITKGVISAQTRAKECRETAKTVQRDSFWSHHCLVPCRHCGYLTAMMDSGRGRVYCHD